MLHNGVLINLQKMTNFFIGQRITSSEGPGEVIATFDDKVAIKLDNGETTTLPGTAVEAEGVNSFTQTDLSHESPAQAEARSEHASEIASRLDHAGRSYSDENSISPPTTMELSEKAMDVINDLIEINNDRIEGFEKAASDLDEQDSDLTTIFNKLANESRENVAELTEIAQNSGQAPVEGTSTSGALHRAWIDVKSVFTGGDRESILDECEHGEDAITEAYRSALDPENEIGYELQGILQKQQAAVVAGHDRIKTLRDQAETEDDVEDENEGKTPGSTGNDPAYQNGAITGASTYGDSTRSNPVYGDAIGTAPSYEGAPGGYQPATAYVEPETAEQEEEEVPSTSNSKLMEFFVDELKDLLWAEKELVDTLPDMAEAATSQELKTAFSNHLAETEVHVSRLEQIFGILGLEPDTTKCDAMSGIVDEGDEIISNTEEGTAQRDVGLIFAGQKAEHYEIASYGGMISLAKTLGYYEIAELLVLTIDEEKSADALLTEIAENHVNYAASTEAAD